MLKGSLFHRKVIFLPVLFEFYPSYKKIDALCGVFLLCVSMRYLGCSEVSLMMEFYGFPSGGVGKGGLMGVEWLTESLNSYLTVI